MQKAISKYGLAAHLALLAVAPLFLYPFCGATWLFRAILWLTIPAAVWVLMEPSRRKDEMPHDARIRVALAVAKDPLFWVMLCLVAVAAVRWANGGVRMVYDAENAVWSLSEAAVTFLPGSVSGSGALPFASALAVLVIVQGCRHALGKAARVAFLFVASLLAGIAAFVAGIACANGSETALAMTQFSTEDFSFVGNAFGLHLMGGVVAISGSFERKWKRALPLLALGIAGCATGLFLFSPAPVALVYLVASLLALALTLVYVQCVLGVIDVAKCLVFLLLAALPAVLFFMGVVPASVKEAKFAILSSGAEGLFPAGFFEARDALSAIAEKVWHDHSWLGTGLGSFGFDIRFNATEEDWALFPAVQAGALNGWWQMLVERGIIGVVFFLAPLFFLVETFVLRAAKTFAEAFSHSRAASKIFSIHPVCGLGLLAAVATAACGFFDHSFWRPETMMATLAMLAMAGSAFPPVKNQTGNELKTEK